MADLTHRRSLRLMDYDYSSPGAYFITITLQDRLELLGKIEEDCVALNEAGKMMEKEWLNLPSRFPFLELVEYLVMPDHFHGIICILQKELSENTAALPGEHKVRPCGTTKNSIGRIIQAYKSKTTVQYGKGVKKYGWEPYNRRLWQRGYYEHVLRNRLDLEETREYIRQNPVAFKYSIDGD